MYLYYMSSFIPLFPTFVKVNKMYILLWNNYPWMTFRLSPIVRFSPLHKSFCCNFYNHIWMDWSFSSNRFLNKVSWEQYSLSSSMFKIVWMGLKFQTIFSVPENIIGNAACLSAFVEAISPTFLGLELFFLWLPNGFPLFFFDIQ